MAEVLKKRRLVNPGRRRRKMSAKQIKYFGTPRQKAALKNHRRRNAGSYSFRKTKKALRKHGSTIKSSKRQKYSMARGSSPASRRSGQSKFHKYLGLRNQGSIVSEVEHAAEDAIRGVERTAEKAIGAVTREANSGRRRNGRRKNVGEILTVIPAVNPGRRRKNMAVRNRRRRRVAVANRSHRRRNRNRNPRVVVRYRNRKANRGHRRRNPNGMGNFLQGDAGAVVGVLGGATVTKLLSSVLPSNLSTGLAGYISTGLIAVVGGNTVGRMMNNKRLGNWMTIGGLVMVGIQVLADYFPQLQLPFTTSSGTSGMGLITSSNFYVPQVNMPGSMASFVTPAGIPAPVMVPSTTLKGFGATGTSVMNSGLRRVGRLR